ncbi:hypothetical protein FKM82_026317 [Ascaphus truei]
MFIQYLNCTLLKEGFFSMQIQYSVSNTCYTHVHTHTHTHTHTYTHTHTHTRGNVKMWVNRAKKIVLETLINIKGMGLKQKFEQQQQLQYP